MDNKNHAAVVLGALQTEKERKIKALNDEYDAILATKIKEIREKIDALATHGFLVVTMPPSPKSSELAELYDSAHATLYVLQKFRDLGYEVSVISETELRIEANEVNIKYEIEATKQRAREILLKEIDDTNRRDHARNEPARQRPSKLHRKKGEKTEERQSHSSVPREAKEDDSRAKPKPFIEPRGHTRRDRLTSTVRPRDKPVLDDHYKQYLNNLDGDAAASK